MPDVCGYWDRRADDRHYSHTTSNGVALYIYRGSVVTHEEREKLRKQNRKKIKKLEEINYSI